MKLADLKISTRLTLLGAFFMLALLAVGAAGWRALTATNAQSAAALAQAGQLIAAVDQARSAQVEFKIQVQEWKNILLRGHEPAQLEKYTAAFKNSSARTQQELKGAQALLAKLGLPTNQVSEALRLHEELGRKYLDALGHFDGSNPASPHDVDTLVKGMDRPPTEKIDLVVKDIRNHANATMAKAAAAREAAQRSATLLQAAIVLAAGLVAGRDGVDDPQYHHPPSGSRERGRDGGQRRPVRPRGSRGCRRNRGAAGRHEDDARQPGRHRGPGARRDRHHRLRVRRDRAG